MRRPFTTADPQPVCMPSKIINIGLNAGQTPPANVPVVGDNAFANVAPEDAGAILASLMLRACDMDFWPNVDYLASKSSTSQKIIVDADANNDNVWLIDKTSGNVFGALGLCGIIPCPGHNVGQFETSHTLAVDFEGQRLRHRNDHRPPRPEVCPGEIITSPPAAKKGASWPLATFVSCFVSDSAL